METFNLVAKVTISMYTKVNALSYDEALKEAADRPLMVVARDGSVDPFVEWVSDEIDGVPYDIILE